MMDEKPIQLARKKKIKMPDFSKPNIFYEKNQKYKDNINYFYKFNKNNLYENSTKFILKESFNYINDANERKFKLKNQLLNKINENNRVKGIYEKIEHLNFIDNAENYK